MGIKPHETRRFALSRGFSGLIYALDTEKPPGQSLEGADVSRKDPRAGETGAGRFWWGS